MFVLNTKAGLVYFLLLCSLSVQYYLEYQYYPVFELKQEDRGGFLLHVQQLQDIGKWMQKQQHSYTMYYLKELIVPILLFLLLLLYW